LGTTIIIRKISLHANINLHQDGLRIAKTRSKIEIREIVFFGPNIFNICELNIRVNIAKQDISKFVSVSLLWKLSGEFRGGSYLSALRECQIEI